MNKMSFVVGESDILPLIHDFNTFCSYIEEHRITLTKKGEVLGKKDLFELNSRMFYKKNVSTPDFQQLSYPLLNMLFHLCLYGKLYRKQPDLNGNIFFIKTERKNEFDTLNNFEKYLFLLEIYWSQFDFGEFYQSRRYYDYIDGMEKIVKTAAHKRPGGTIVKGAFTGDPEHDYMLARLYHFVYHMSFFGFWIYEEIEAIDKKQYPDIRSSPSS